MEISSRSHARSIHQTLENIWARKERQLKTPLTGDDIYEQAVSLACRHILRGSDSKIFLSLSFSLSLSHFPLILTIFSLMADLNKASLKKSSQSGDTLPV